MSLRPGSIKQRGQTAAAFLLALLLLLLMAAPAYADINGKVTGGNVNIRSGAGTAYNVIGAANKGDSFVVLNREGDWYVIRYRSGVKGYINAQYLTTAQDSRLPATVKAASGSVNIRAGASSGDALLGSFSGNTALTVSGENGYWYAVKYNGKTGYVAKWLVTADYSAAPEPVENSIYAPALVNTETLNLRDAPDGEIIGKLSSGTRIYVQGSRDGWYQAETPSGSGWVHGAYVLFDQAQNSARVLAESKPPSFAGHTAQGRISVDWQQENFGFVLTLSGDTLIRYELKEHERGFSLITDMEFAGQLPGGLGMQMYTEGEFDNILTVNGSDVLYWRLAEENHGRRLTLSVGLSPLIGRVVYIDPGHASINESGKIDPGTMRGNLQEKDITYEIALYMQTMLSEKGATVLLSRGETTDLTLERRAYPANAAGADILVSVHVNSATNTNANGSSTWFYAPADDYGYDRAACKLLAQCIQNSLLSRTGLGDYGVREANFAVLRASAMPAVLVETAFITNDADMARLSDSYFRRQAAEGIVEGIIEYFRLNT